MDVPVQRCPGALRDYHLRTVVHSPAASDTRLRPSVRILLVAGSLPHDGPVERLDENAVTTWLLLQ